MTETSGSRTRFVVCGETLIDLVRSAEPGDTRSSTWHALSAGGPMNSALALGRLGQDSHFLGRLSSDRFGAQLRSHIAASGVHLDLASESSQATSIAVVSLDERGAASYTFHFADTANFGWLPEDLPVLDPGDWLHIASLACVVSPGAEVLLDWARQTTARMSYDINVRPTVISDPEVYWDRVEPWLQVVGQHGGIVKASDEDVAFLGRVGADQPDPVDLAAAWVEQFGLGLMVLTLGPGGGVAIEPGGHRTAGAGFPTAVVDTVGAGDTYMAGFLDAYVSRGLDLSASLRRAAAAASINCTREGAQPPTADEVEAFLAS